MNRHGDTTRIAVAAVLLFCVAVAAAWVLRALLPAPEKSLTLHLAPGTSPLIPSADQSKLKEAAEHVPVAHIAPATSGFELAMHPSESEFDVPAIGLALRGDDVVPAEPQPNAAGSDLLSRHDLIEANLAMEKARQFVTAMCSDMQGNVWVATEGGGVERFDPSAPPWHQWKQFTVKEGLGDDYCYAIACDRKGRIWVGTLRHGISVFNGQSWKSYEVVAGLTSPETLAGPLGERVFHITVCPTDGDVWMATSCGLARYSESRDNWSYYTERNGLPSDQANSIAFDGTGNIYVATQCDGIAVAQAQDQYNTWYRVTARTEEPPVPDGDGLPTNLINDILVARDGTLYAATNSGLAWSENHAASWEFVRGEDWAPKAPRELRQRLPRIGGSLLAEDYCTCLAEDAGGGIWVGHRAIAGADVVTQQIATLRQCPADYINAILTRPGDSPWVGTYGGGVQFSDDASGNRSSFSARTDFAAIAPFPSGAKAMTPSQLRLLVPDHLGNSTAIDNTVIYLGADWTSQGDWSGRYGWSQAVLFGSVPPLDHLYDLSESFKVRPRVGPLAKAGETARAFLRELYTDDPRSLWDLDIDSRRQSEWDDHGESYGAWIDGPDLQMKFELPEGVYRVALYVVNPDGHAGAARRRDLLLQVKPYFVDAADVAAAPAEAQCRIQDFYGGVYEQFLMRGPSKHFFLLRRNHSLNALCSGAFFERLSGPHKPTDNMARSMMGNIHYQPPATPDISGDSDGVKSAMDIWKQIDTAYRAASPNVDGRHEWIVQCYRLAAASGAPDALLVNWRWSLPLWTTAERAEWVKTMQDAFEGELRMNPKWAKKIGNATNQPPGANFFVKNQRS
jgi:hypothetical protein